MNYRLAQLVFTLTSLGDALLAVIVLGLILA